MQQAGQVLRSLSRLPVSWVVVGVSALYLVAELRYNLSLIALVSNPDATKDTIADLSHTGKILAAFGLVWSFVFPALRRRVHFLPVLAALFVLIWWGAYSGINRLYDAVLDQLDSQTISNSVSLLSYRVEVTSGRISDPTVSRDGRFDPLAMIALPVMAFDQRDNGYMAFARATLDQKVNTALARQGGDRVSLERSGGQLREAYRSIMKAVTDLHKQFVDQSLRVAGDPMAEDMFKRRSGGLAPNPFITREDFFSRLLPQSNQPQAQRLVAEWRAPRGAMPDGGQFSLSNLPPFLDDAALDELIAKKIDALAEQGLAEGHKAAEGGPEARTFAAAVLVPPISMTLSLFTLITGLGTLVYAVLLALGKKPRLPMLAFQALPLVLVLLLAPASGFTSDSGMAKMEAMMTADLTLIGPVWRKATAVEGSLLALTGHR